MARSGSAVTLPGDANTRIKQCNNRLNLPKYLMLIEASGDIGQHCTLRSRALWVCALQYHGALLMLDDV